MFRRLSGPCSLLSGTLESAVTIETTSPARSTSARMATNSSKGRLHAAGAGPHANGAVALLGGQLREIAKRDIKPRFARCLGNADGE